MKSQGNKTNQVLLERGDGIHNLVFSWCHFPSTATPAGGEGLDFRDVHRKHHCINPVEVVKCLAMQSVMSQTSFFSLSWHLWALLQILRLLVTGPESLVIFLFENEEKKTPQIWGNPQGKICFGGRGLWKFWRKVLTVKGVHVLHNSEHEKKQNSKESGDFNKFWNNSVVLQSLYLLD